MTGWVEFDCIKRSVSLEAVLRHYHWTWTRRRGHRVQGLCLIHRGERDDAFHADLRGNGFHCFACGAKGSVLDLVAALEHCSLRAAAFRLRDWFALPPSPPLPGPSPDAANHQLIRKKERLVVPLRFSLHPVDFSHPYLALRGIEHRTAEHFGVGYYSGPGLMRGRVVIPIHDGEGRLAAYAGRSTGQAVPKYLLPPGFAKSRILYNLHRARALRSAALVVVEGFFDCINVSQAGYAAVALMGCSLSQIQQEQLLSATTHVVLMLDADTAGWNATAMIVSQLHRRCRVDVIRLAPGEQPDRLSSDNIVRILAGIVPTGSSNQ